jgi:hypothetical protein
MNPGKQPPGRPVLSAAAALGGKVSPHSVRIPITNVYMDGDYTGAIEVGSQKTVCNVLLDTGSSTLAVDGNHFNVGDDKTASITDLAQEISYADKSRWIGGVIQTNVTVARARNLPPSSESMLQWPITRPRTCSAPPTAFSV